MSETRIMSIRIRVTFYDVLTKNGVIQVREGISKIGILALVFTLSYCFSFYKMLQISFSMVSTSYRYEHQDAFYKKAMFFNIFLDVIDKCCHHMKQHKFC